MSAFATFVLLVCGVVGALFGLAGGFWLGVRLVGEPFGPPNSVGVLLFMGLLLTLFTGFIAYLEWVY